jgi:hypothetical protein
VRSIKRKLSKTQIKSQSPGVIRSTISAALGAGEETPTFRDKKSNSAGSI